VDVFFRAFERVIFANDDARDFIQERGAAAHGAGGKRRVESAAAINGSVAASGVFKAIHFGMVNDAALLDALVVPASDDLATVDENGTDWYAAFGEAFFCFVNRSREEGIHDWMKAGERKKGKSNVEF